MLAYAHVTLRVCVVYTLFSSCPGHNRAFWLPGWVQYARSAGQAAAAGFRRCPAIRLDGSEDPHLYDDGLLSILPCGTWPLVPCLEVRLDYSWSVVESIATGCDVRGTRVLCAVVPRCVAVLLMCIKGKF